MEDQREEELLLKKLEEAHVRKTEEVSVQEIGDLAKEDILTMFAHCNVIELHTEDSQFIETKVKPKEVGKPILPCTFGGTSYYGLYDIGKAVNVIPFNFYFKTQKELAHAELEDTNMTIMLAALLGKHLESI